MATQGSGTAAAKNNARTGCGCLVLVVIVVIVIAAIAGGSSNSGSGGGGASSASPASASSGEQHEAQEYIKEKEHTINLGRVDYEHVVALAALAEKSGSVEVLDEIAKSAQEAHDEIDGFREELFKSDGDKKLSEATFLLSEGANELKNALGALVGYSGNPNPATLAHFSIQMQKAQEKWNAGVDEIWEIAHEHNAPRLEASNGRKAAEAVESIETH